MSDEAERLYEQLLVLRCQTGDEHAFRELVGRYGPRLAYYLRKLFSNADWADDVAQDVWLDVFRQLPRLQDVGAFAQWLYRIARGHGMLAARRRGRMPTTTEDVDLVVDRKEPAFSPDDAAAIHAALDQLEPAHREALVLRFLEDLSYEEIGVIVGCPTGTVRSRIHYAKLSLKRLLDRYRDG
jgi:RNA polymerase sigma-70 factor (ECF subfamily)